MSGPSYLPSLLLALVGGLLLWRRNRARFDPQAIRVAGGVLMGVALWFALFALKGGDRGTAILAEVVLFGGVTGLSLLGWRASPRSPSGFAGALLVTTSGLLLLLGADQAGGLLVGSILVAWGLARALREGFWGEPATWQRAFAFGLLGLGAIVIGVGCVFALTGSLRLSPLALPAGTAVVDSLAPLEVYVLPGLGVALIALGLAFPLGVLPLHSWLPEVCQEVPAGIALWICVAFPAAGVGALAHCVLGAGALEVWVSAGFDPRHFLAPLGVVTTTLALLVALRGAGGLKQTLAYLAIAQSGTLLLAVAYLPPGTSALSAGVVLPAVAVALTNAAGFAFVAVLEERQADLGLRGLVGLGSREPYLAAMLAVVLASHAGLPLTVGFMARLQLVLAGVAAPVPPSYLVLAAFDLALALAVALRLGRLLVHESAKPPAPTAPTGAVMLCGVLTALVLLLGLQPSGLLIGVTP